MRFLYIVGCLTAVCTSSALAQVERHVHDASGAHDLGVVEFENSGATAAQEPFLRGLALLHSFEYDEAAESFRQAQRDDPKFAMAYWGEALTYAHLLWGEDDPESARRALNRLAPTEEARLAAAGTPRERAYGVAVEALFADTDPPARVRGFADAMQRVVAQHPDDLDAAAFGALASMFAEYVGDLSPEQSAAARERAISLAEHVFEKQPRHPGGTHYLIHATDDPRFASRGLPAARMYAETAPAAEHALHMPSHIFLQLGMWRDVVVSNERAWAASRAEVSARNLSPADVGFHELQWLQYAYLQQGRYRAAKALIDTARAVLAGIDLNSGQHVDARFTVAELEFMHAVHSGQWEGAICARAKQPASMRPPGSERERSFQSIAVYHRAVAAAMCGEADGPVLQQLRARVSAMAQDDPALPMLRAAVLHADAVAAERRGDHARVIDLLTAAAAAPARPPVGPPYTLRVHELFGAALLEAGRAREAVAAYERALQLTPGRSSALLGLARARATAGDRAAALDAYRALVDNWQHADADLAVLDEVRRLSTAAHAVEPPTMAADTLYRVTMIRAAPGQWIALKALIERQGQAGTTDDNGRTIPYRLRHSQGDHWDFMLIQPIGSLSAHFADERQAREAPFRDQVAELADFNEDWIVSGPSHGELDALFDGAGLYHLEIFRARAGMKDELVDQRVRENGFLAAAGLVTNAVFVGVFGADWDAATIGFHKDWVAYGAPGALSVEEQEAAARANGFDGLAAIAPYLRTLLVGHNDTFAVPMR